MARLVLVFGIGYSFFSLGGSLDCFGLVICLLEYSSSVGINSLHSFIATSVRECQMDSINQTQILYAFHGFVCMHAERAMIHVVSRLFIWKCLQ